MGQEFYSHRFLFLVMLFVLSIVILIFSSNFVSLILGWDGLGLRSFLLVIYYQNSYCAGRGLITGLTNRVGDVFFIIIIGMMLGSGSWQICRVEVVGVVGSLIILGAMTKRAQFPFSRWLPLAIAAPTPVSSLVHSSTLVTAGVYVMFRFRYCVDVKLIILFGRVTMLIAGSAALVEFDIKKVIAFSTLRQLGIIIVSLGFGAVDLTFFHLLRHAIFKAVLFIRAGVYIHFYLHIQDLRVIGGVRGSSLIVQRVMVFASLALCGFPFMAGFYSKDPILEVGMVNDR